jgi:serine-protein kinase ATM
MLVAKLIEYHEIGEDVNAMITAADVSGPVILCDSALFLMMHLLHVRVTEVPGASLVACQHVIRWVFARWNPGERASFRLGEFANIHTADRSVAGLATVHVKPRSLVDLLRTTLGLERAPIPSSSSMACGSIAQAWQQHLETEAVVRYILLLEEPDLVTNSSTCPSCPKHSDPHSVVYVSDTSHFLSTNKLIFELLLPKLRELAQSWNIFAADRSSSISADTYRRAVNACITMLLLMPHFADITSPQFEMLDTYMQSLALQLVQTLRDTGLGYQALMEALLQAVQPYLPACDSHEFQQLSEKAPHLLRFFVLTVDEFNRRSLMRPTSLINGDDDLMDLDDDFSQQSQTTAEGQSSILSRRCLQLEMSLASNYLVTIRRLELVATSSESPGFSGFVPSIFVDRLVSLNNEEFLSCRQLLRQILSSDLVVDVVDAIRLVSHIGDILSSSEFSRCEISQCLCLDILVGLAELWPKADSNFAEPASELYQWFIGTALDGDIASAEVQKGIAKLLLKLLLLRIEPMRASDTTVPSPRSSLINVLQKGNASVKFYIGNQLPDVFELFILKDHDAVFVDILENLPSDPDWIEGISFRLFVLAKLASKWSTLLRRCIYHIFETPGRIQDSVRHATRCLISISSALKVASPRELFGLFAPQLLYTWLESDNIEDIPYQIFGFSSLQDLLVGAKEEAAGLMIMRGQDEAVEYLAKVLGMSKVELLQKCFCKVMAYTIAYDISTPPADKSQRHITGEARVRKCLNQTLYFECVHLHFAEIIALFFNIIDHGDMEKYLMKKEDSVYAGDIMKEIKSMNLSDVALPPNQQPTFRAKYLTHWIQHLCSRTPYETQSLYTPALVSSIARKLLNTIHPALGSLHACSVLRKLRVLISLSGDTAVNGYPLEMLLQSVSSFITDPECADDAIGIVKYLLVRGSHHLSQWPSFVAGVALSILGSLRIFLQSQESTEDTQYRETTSRTQAFYAWMRAYVSDYRSPVLQNKSKLTFRALVQSAYNIGLVGNAATGSPESDLLFRLLQDEQADESILSRPARESALKMLCSEFQCTTNFRTDIFGVDELAIANAAVVWKSCRVDGANKQYLLWAGRVLGRAFAASGQVHPELLQESTLSQIKELPISLKADDSSRACVLSLLQSLTLAHDQRTVGLAESALRVIVSTSDDLLTGTCQRYLSLSLQVASTWTPYQTPLSETTIDRDFISSLRDPFAADAVQRPDWLRDLAIVIAQFIPDDPVLRALVPVLREVNGFAERTFPFVLHIVLSAASQGHHLAKKQLSTSIAIWFGDCQAVEKNCLKLLINSMLYLRTQPLPKEKSTAERSHWLDIDYMKAATAATHCGMYKTALLFAEEYYSEPAPSKSSRRSSTIIHQAPELPTEILLSIFQNIDDPDLYYGVPQKANLSTILARLEYEKDGSKSLAFRGAQYDSHIRRHDPESAHDVQSIVKALDVLSLSGLSHSLLQAQQTVGMSTTSLESMFLTARKLEQWDLPVPSTSNNNAGTIYKAFQAVNNAPDHAAIMREINEGFDSTMTRLIRDDLSANALHGTLQTLTALVEMDEVFSTRGSQEFEELTSRFQSRAGWMKTGR